MIKVNKNHIYMTRGDTFIATVTLTDKEGNEYEPVAGDSIRFALKHPQIKSDKMGYIDDEPLILKTIPIDTLELQLDPIDTKPLPFGSYVYDIEITYADGSVDTFITTAAFDLLPEVH